MTQRQFTAILAFITFSSGLGLGYLFWGLNEKAPTDPRLTSSSALQIATEPFRVEVSVDDDPAIGSDNAPITIIEFGDFECPFCTQFHNETLSTILDQYGDQIRFVYRDFPLTGIHPQAFPAAEAANCALEQGKYWEYHDELFNAGPQALGQESYRLHASELNLDMTSFQECVDTRKYQAEVQADLDDALRLGLRGTPSFFINGIPLVGAQPFEAFKEIIESELARVVN